MKQATFITGLSCVGFAVGLAAFIGSRLSEQAIALMAGAIFGMLVALPIGALIGWAVKGSRTIERNTAPAQPMVIMTQPQLPAASPYISAAGHPGWQQFFDPLLWDYGRYRLRVHPGLGPAVSAD